MDLQKTAGYGIRVLVGMEDKYYWILPDLPGSGQSAFNRTLTDIQRFSEALHAIMEHEKIRKLVLIGHSMGGYISLAFAEKYPDKISRPWTVSFKFLCRFREKKESRDKNIRFIQKNGSALFVEQAIPGLVF